ncbi:MAG: hypothetical protein COU63_02440 [Candidatus Pacebacteria bacterium CG10_big_fil_rev_8_21_14_0_10_36_11]|nr:MAG: hypothetical protein COU63_02440 [Candidatus Pacebacteria bacterium CG10_big_fil_rev_8_21_14_0_10_36_11]PJC42455.1 MAG: hypothetical protein CO040_04335 [Candidatus Pacebacteria bacterium CG_4_9_14_0_2_um_filter_36_8]
MPTTKRKTSFSKKQRTKKQQANNSFAVFVGWILILWSSFYFARKYFWQQYTTLKIIPNESYFVTNIDFPSLNTNEKCSN